MRMISIGRMNRFSQGSQALALMVTGDRAVFHNVHLLGNQDTVYAGEAMDATRASRIALRRDSTFLDCYVAGNVDFIFGDGSRLCSIIAEIHSTTHAGRIYYGTIKALRG